MAEPSLEAPLHSWPSASAGPSDPLQHSLLFSTTAVPGFVHFLQISSLSPTFFLDHQKTIDNLALYFTKTKPTHRTRHQLKKTPISCHHRYQPLCIWMHPFLLSSIQWKRDPNSCSGLILPCMLWILPSSAFRMFMDSAQFLSRILSLFLMKLFLHI